MEPQPKAPQINADNRDTGSQRRLCSYGLGSLPRFEDLDSFLRKTQANFTFLSTAPDTNWKTAPDTNWKTSSKNEVRPDSQL